MLYQFKVIDKYVEKHQKPNYPIFMKKFYLLPVVFFTFFSLYSSAQCTNTVLDWDYRDFFARNNSTIRGYVSLAQSQNQRFAFGANTLIIQHTYTDNNSIGGENTTHTGETGSYGSGADVQFTGDGTITLTFAQPVTNVQFSLYDIDRNQRADINAFNGATPVNVSLSTVGGGSSILTVSNNNSTSARVGASDNSRNNASNEATVNIDIASPVTSVTITISNTGTCNGGSCSASGGTETGVFWLSDISACSPGAFPNNYHHVSRPFTGMPSYIITVRNNVFYYVDVATGRAKHLFTDPGSNNYNSVAYDPYNRYLYYTRSLSGSGGAVNPNERALRRYDYNMDTFGVVMNDGRDLGIPIFAQGVESGAAAFYNGNLYWGIEANQNANLESTIWRIEFDANNYPNGFSQVYAQPVYDGSSRTHDWADFGISNGILYDFDGGVANSPTAQNANFFVQNLLTGSVNAYIPATSPLLFAPRQTAVDWQGNIYNVGPLQLTGSTQGEISLFNGTDNISNHQIITFSGSTPTGSWGDAAEAFRPFCDFGDAPASYEGADPIWGLAVHERNNNLYLGNGLDIEWLKKGTTVVEDTDDGLDAHGVPIFVSSSSSYQCRVQVYNNTGANATLIGWLDFNNDGIFTANEGRAITVPPSASSQDLWLEWTGITAENLPDNSTTYLRLRIAPTAAGMTTSHPTGYFDGGEVEDYSVLVNNLVLPANLTSFVAKAVNNTKVQLNWKAAEEPSFNGYEIERSQNGTDWEKIGHVTALRTNNSSYEWIDPTPHKGTSYYRLKLVDNNSSLKYSSIQSVQLRKIIAETIISPNPATDKATLLFKAEALGEIAHIRIANYQGAQVYYKKVKVVAGDNLVDIPLQSSWAGGTYLVSLVIGNDVMNSKLIIRK